MLFSFFRSIFRRTITRVLLCVFYLIEFVNSINDRRFPTECKPFLTNAELLSFSLSPIDWLQLVQPLASRCHARKFGEEFRKVDKNSIFEEANEATRPKVMVCHDMAGNYHEDRFISGSNKWDDYRFYHWSGIDYFCYFSHNYITIPPLTWINAAHHNGVPILGTFIVEPGRGEELLRDVLHSDNEMNSIVEALVLVTKAFGFEGWLVNIECELSEQQVLMLRKFVWYLTKRTHEDVPGGKVFWYDSVINTGSLSWQNELNETNVDFYRVADGILLNYNWDEDNLRRTANILNNDAEAMTKVYVGIDVFGRGQVAKFHTCETLRKIKEFNFSVGIFAPGWTFEGTEDIGLKPFAAIGTDVCNQQFIRRNNIFWTMLWEYLYTSGPNKLPFYTSFCLGSGKRKFRDGILMQNRPWFNLMEQEYQPSVPSVFQYQFEEAYRGGSCIQFVGDVQNLRLFATDFACDNNIVVSYVFKRSDPQIQLQLMLNITSDNGERHLHVICDDGNGVNDVERPGERYLSPLRTNFLRFVIISLSQRQEKLFPTSSSRPINGWETRYFYLNFAEDAKWSRIIDVGITVRKGDWSADDSVLLGAVHIQAGVLNDKRISEAHSLLQIEDFAVNSPRI